MEEIKISPTLTLRPNLGCGAGHPQPSSGGDDGLERVTLVASAAKLEQPIEVPRDEFLVTVCIGLGAPLELTTSVPGMAERKLTQATGEVCMLGPRSTVVFSRSLHNQALQYRLPRMAIRGLAKHWKLGQIDSLKSPMVSRDPVLHHLSRVMCLLLEQPRASKTTIADQFVHSFYFHLLQHYGVQSGTVSEFSGGLSPKHKRIVDNAFSGSFHGDVTIQYLADQCELSTGHFARVFRQTFGRPFHQHIMKARIQRAKELLRKSDMSLREIARTIGYADQATFTESFTRATRVSPGRFRREHIGA